MPDGSYIVCGTTPEWGTDSAYHYGWILKVDTSGTIIWEQKYVAYERFGTNSYLYDIDVLPNGDLLACGELRFTTNVGITPIQQGWILRTDSNGCVVENCLVGIDGGQMTDDGGQIQVYPNPASGYVQLEVSNEMLGGEVRVYDVTGKVVKEWRVRSNKWQVDVSDLGKGLYVVAATNGEKTARAKLVVE